MVNKKELEIHTVIVDGSPSSFKAALSRSLLGVSWIKFKRKKQAFYQHRVHNLAITQSVFNWLYEYLLKHLKNVSKYKLKTDLKPIWDENGKIRAIADVTVSVYMKVGELKVEELQVHERFKNIKIDFFYSEIDARSKKLRLELPHIIESMGKENFDYSEYDFLTKEGREMAEAYNIKHVPTIVINAEKSLEDPDEKKLRQEIEGAFTPVVKPSVEPQFLFDPMTKSTVESLIDVLEIKLVNQPKHAG